VAKDDKTPLVPEEKAEDKKDVPATEADPSNDEKKPENPEEKAPPGQMFIKVYSPFKSYYEGLGKSISAANDTGPFDILPGHHRFLTLISTCEIDIQTADGTEVDKIKIDRGIMYVKTDRVTVFLDV
jgi:hypothetical protein